MILFLAQSFTTYIELSKIILWRFSGLVFSSKACGNLDQAGNNLTGRKHFNGGFASHYFFSFPLAEFCETRHKIFTSCLPSCTRVIPSSRPRGRSRAGRSGSPATRP